MMMTEDQARERSCKYIALRASTAHGASAGYNRTRLHWKTDLRERFINWMFPGFYWYTRARFFRCDAGRCMHWRWGDNKQRYGYCGLAGKPDTDVILDAPVKKKLGLLEELLMMFAVSLVSGILVFVGRVAWMAFN
jgi:hypothetical protein